LGSKFDTIKDAQHVVLESRPTVGMKSRKQKAEIEGKVTARQSLALPSFELSFAIPTSLFIVMGRL
jgi:hypothetical protein